MRGKFVIGTRHLVRYDGLICLPTVNFKVSTPSLVNGLCKDPKNHRSPTGKVHIFSSSSLPRSCQERTDISNDTIAEGQYYEAHQQLRVIASRYVKSESWDAAIDLLFGGALALLKAGQGGSGGDMAIFLVDVLGKAGNKVGIEERSMYQAS